MGDVTHHRRDFLPQIWEQRSIDRRRRYGRTFDARKLIADHRGEFVETFKVGSSTAELLRIGVEGVGASSARALEGREG